MFYYEVFDSENFFVGLIEATDDAFAMLLAVQRFGAKVDRVTMKNRSGADNAN